MSKLASLSSSLVALLALLAFPLVSLSCSGEPSDLEIAKQRLSSFHEALVAGDHARIRELVSDGSKPFASRLPRPPHKVVEPLEILRSVREGSRITFAVRDPNPGAPAERGSFVVVRERGKWCVDLVATAGANSREEFQPGGKMRLVPKALSAEERKQARRAMEASFKKKQNAQRSGR